MYRYTVVYRYSIKKRPIKKEGSTAVREMMLNNMILSN